LKTAIVTGANGFIGAHVVYRLLAQGWRVEALGRSTRTSPWSDRLIVALREVGSIADHPDNLSSHPVDLLSAEMKLDFLLRKDFSPEKTTLFHLAGDTRFTPSNPDFQRQVNIQGALNVINALKGRIARAIHVSTAYVAGNRPGSIREDELDCGQSFRNPYEKSKLDAEIAVTAFCREHNVPLVIVRPAIIINDRQTGRASTFTHLNALVEVVSRIQEHYGISDGQVVSKRIRLVGDPEARPNLAPVDSIVPPLLKIAESSAAPGRAFHLCHPRPQSNIQLVNLACEAFKIKGLVALEFLENMPISISRTEETILRSFKVYAPYMNSRCEFDLSNSRSIVPDYDSYFTQLDVPYIRKVIEFQRQHRK
jgi:nucleoside-diphosphate-sugar epimerase